VNRRKRLLTSVRPALSRVLPNFHSRVRGRGACALVNCPECGEERVDPLVVTVRARIEIDEWSYRFICPSCNLRAVASTSREAALQAVEAGATLESWRWSSEADDPDHNGPPLSLADLLDLRVALSEPSWFETLSTADNATAKHDPDL
jgi:predicted RNA-binding Zn-ribbon protein involved in translation (DUF1610 family)